MPVEGTNSPSPGMSPMFDDSFLSSFRNSLLQARQFLSQGTLFSLFAESTGQPPDTFEYKPELPVAQPSQNIVHKYRFDRLVAPQIERGLDSPASFDSLDFDDIPLSDHKETVNIDGQETESYGRRWLRRYLSFDNHTYARKCEEFVARFGTFSDPQDLQEQLSTILKSKDSSTCILCCSEL
jgi:hypothetical protein